MNHISFPVIRWAIAAMALLLGFSVVSHAEAGEGGDKYEAVLIWGTDKQSQDPKHKPVEDKLAEKFKKLFKWQYYYEVNRSTFSVKVGETKKVTMSKQCDIQVRRVDAETVEVELWGKGKRVSKSSQKLPKSGCFVTGGDAADSTGWFVILRQKE